MLCMLFDTLNELSREAPLTLDVRGDCMTGSLANGSQVQIERQAYYLPGDIIVYGRGDDQLVVHRFLGYVRGPTGWLGITQADKMRVADSPVATGKILGKVLRVDNEPSVTSPWQRLRSFVYYWPAVTRWAGRGLGRRVFKRVKAG